MKKETADCPASGPARHRLDERCGDLFAVLDRFPVPAEVFAADGTSLFVNRAFTEAFRIDADQLVGELNVLADPFLNDELRLAEPLQRVLAGETVIVHDVQVPLAEIGRRRLARGEVSDGSRIYQDIACLPLREADGTLVCVVVLFVTKHVYEAHPAVSSAREYIQARWRDEFDLAAIAEHAGISRHHLSRLFRRFLGKTPYRHYQDVKIEQVKRALRDPALSISQAFASCGVAYTGSYARAFRRAVGLTPTEYRAGCAPDSPPPPMRPATVTAPRPRDNDEERMFEIVDLLPIPVQVFRPDGEAAFINQAVLRAWNVRDADPIVGSYNLRSDPLVNDEQGLREYIERAFAGETVLVPDVRVPLETFWESYPKASPADDPGAIYTDILNFPVRDAAGRLSHVMSIFLASRIYRGRPEVARAQEYLENNWRGPFDADLVAGLVNLSPSQLSRVFRQETGMTPYGYYQEMKVARLKESLRNPDLSVAQAFRNCGLEHGGNATRFFKERTGMTPTQYRAALQDERSTAPSGPVRNRMPATEKN